MFEQLFAGMVNKTTSSSIQMPQLKENEHIRE